MIDAACNGEVQEVAFWIDGQQLERDGIVLICGRRHVAERRRIVDRIDRDGCRCRCGSALSVADGVGEAVASEEVLGGRVIELAGLGIEDDASVARTLACLNAEAQGIAIHIARNRCDADRIVLVDCDGQVRCSWRIVDRFNGDGCCSGCGSAFSVADGVGEAVASEEVLGGRVIELAGLGIEDDASVARTLACLNAEAQGIAIHIARSRCNTDGIILVRRRRYVSG